MLPAAAEVGDAPARIGHAEKSHVVEVREPKSSRRSSSQSSAVAEKNCAEDCALSASTDASRTRVLLGRGGRRELLPHEQPDPPLGRPQIGRAQRTVEALGAFATLLEPALVAEVLRCRETVDCGAWSTWQSSPTVSSSRSSA